MTSNVLAAAHLPTENHVLQMLVLVGGEVVETHDISNGDSLDLVVYDDRTILIGEVDEGRSLLPPCSPFIYDMEQKVEIKCSGEQGLVKGRAEYAACDKPKYYIEYKAADGRAVTDWWNEESIQAA